METLQARYPEEEEKRNELDELLDELNDDPLEEFFRNLKTIRYNQEYRLPPPSKNSFKITTEGIIFSRNRKQETRKIVATNKLGARLFVDDVSYHPDGWTLNVTAKKWVLSFTPEPQLLHRREIAKIFTSIEQGKNYCRPNQKDGHTFKTIIEVSKI